jgi:hypothetical protein
MEAHLAHGQDTVHLPQDGLITPQIRLGIEIKAAIETEVVPLIFSHKFDRKPERSSPDCNSRVIRRGGSVQ